MRTSGFILIVAAASAAVAGCTKSSPTPKPPAATTYTVTVDFGEEVAAKSMSGFLQAFNETNPPDDKILPLKPAHLRSGYFRTNYDRARRLGMTVHAVLSDTWGYPSPELGWPYQNYSAFEARVKKIAASFIGKPIVWDIWNEPDSPFFWAGTRSQYFETFRRAYFALREVLGDGLEVEGPSISQYDGGFLTDFLDDALANGVKVQWLTWHELGNNVRQVANLLTGAKSSFLQNAKYTALGLKGILINEVTSEGNQYNPAHILGYLAMLEKGGAAGACKSCWSNLAGDPFINCNNWSLDGILNPWTFQPRAAWWLYKMYGDGAASRVRTDSIDDAVYALGSARSEAAETAQVLVGYYSNDVNTPSKTVYIHLKNIGSLPFLAGATQVKLRFERLLNYGESVIDGPAFVRDNTLTISGGAVLTDISSFDRDEVYRITISL
jgi:hypothetical protein